MNLLIQNFLEADVNYAELESDIIISRKLAYQLSYKHWSRLHTLAYFSNWDEVKDIIFKHIKGDFCALCNYQIGRGSCTNCALECMEEHSPWHKVYYYLKGNKDSDKETFLLFCGGMVQWCRRQLDNED